MPLPTNVGTGTVTGTFLLENGDPWPGVEFTFTPTAARWLNAGSVPPVVIKTAPRTGTTDSSGVLPPVTLIANLDEDLGLGWRYNVTCSDAAIADFQLDINVGQNLDLATLIPATEPPLAAIVRGVGLPAGGTTGQVATKASNADFDITWSNPGGGGGGAVNSVNGEVGDVVLSAADVGALPDSTVLFSGAYADLTGKPTLFSGAYADLTGKPTIPAVPADIGAQPAGDYATTSQLFSGAYGDLTGIPSTFAPAAHNHDDRYYTETETDTLLAGKSDTTHNHDARYYTEAEIDTELNGKADVAGGITKIEQITAAAYAGLGTKDAGTLYVVVG